MNLYQQPACDEQMSLESNQCSYKEIPVMHLNRNQGRTWKINDILMNCIWNETKGITNSSQQVFPHMTHVVNKP